MLFNSVQFFVFFCIVFGLYTVLSHRWQNRMLLVASYIFYAAWDWRFLSLIWLSTFIDYWCGARMGEATTQSARKKYVVISVLTNLGILGFFKYCNFFSQSLADLLSLGGWNINPLSLQIILPVGISFYTFQSMSYTIDIYRGQLKPQKSFLEFALFVAFFPQLVAGPIERARHLLPQIERPRKLSWEEFGAGCYLVLWGLFLKVCVADNLATMVDKVFALDQTPAKEQIMIGTYAFAFQIFGDFAGYSNIARGISKCLGFDIMNNFHAPYLAVNPSEFWRRWHISLSTWLKDYLYIPLGGNRHGDANTLRNLMLTMVIGGLWHGAAWTFVIWGFYHGLLLVVYRLAAPLGKVFSTGNRIIAMIWRYLGIIVFFHLVCLGWLIFRAQSLEQLLSMLNILFVGPFNLPWEVTWAIMKKLAFYGGPVLVLQVFQDYRKDVMAMYRLPWFLRGIFYYALIMMILIYGVTEANDFIYFQF